MKSGKSIIWMINGISITFAPVMIDRRERNRSLLLLSKQVQGIFSVELLELRQEMNTENQTRVIEAKVVELLAVEPGYFVVEVSVRPTNNIKVIVDADMGASIDKLTKLNKLLYRWVEENLFPNGDFSMEISSPGLEEPLKLQRQYLKNIGRPVEVVLKSGIKKEGKLVSVTDTDIIVEEEIGKGKKKELIQHKILKQEIKATRIQVKF